jgi:D-alanyl-D-alanine carboxypeptidase
MGGICDVRREKRALMTEFSLRAACAALAVLLIAAIPQSGIVAVNDAVTSVMQNAGIPGAEVGIVRDGALVLDRGYGMANVDAKAHVDAGTHFEIGSITKQFTAAAILQLKEDGKLELSDRLGKYVPEYPLGKNVTLEQLLWQISGIPNYTEVNHFIRIAGAPPGGIDAALALIAKQPLHFRPGTRWEYSNTNYLLLGAVVARVSHMPWESYVRKNIFARAGMTHSAFIQDEPSLSDMAIGYTMGQGKQKRLRRAPPLIGAWAGSAGGIVTTVADLAKWDLAFFGGKIVNASDVKLATAAYHLPSGRSTDYGFGWMIDSFDGEPRIEHGGGTLGFTSINEYFPKQQEFFIAFINDSSADATSVGNAAFEALNPAIAKAAREPVPGENPKITALARQWLRRAQTGEIDRSQLTASFSASLNAAAVAETKAQMAPLGAPTSFIYRGKSSLAGVTVYRYRVSFKSGTLKLTIGIDRAGKIAGIDFGLD